MNGPDFEEHLALSPQTRVLDLVAHLMQQFVRNGKNMASLEIGVTLNGHRGVLMMEIGLAMEGDQPAANAPAPGGLH